MFNDTVHEAQETAKQNDYGFNPDEVDYDEEDEEMKQEAEEDAIVEDEDEEMEPPPETEEPVKLPAWALNLEAGSKKMPVRGLINNDVSETAAHLFDNATIAKILAMYKFYYKQRVTMKPEEYHDMMTTGPLGRIDLDGFCPYTGDNEDGSLKRPSEDELNALFEDKEKDVKWSKRTKLYNGRPKEMLMDVVLTLETYERMMEYLVLAGYTPESLSFLIPMTKQQNTMEKNKVMREKISDFLRRLLKGAYPDAEHYTYFRTGNHGFPNCIDIPAFSVFLSLREKEARIELLITAQQCGVHLPAIFIGKIAYALQYAEAESVRGKIEMKTKMTPNLEEEVTQTVFKSVADNAGVREAAADAAAKSGPTQKGHPPSGEPKARGPRAPPAKAKASGSAPSSSSSPQPKAMPRTAGPSSTSSSSAAKAAPKHSRPSTSEKSQATPKWKKVRRDE